MDFYQKLISDRQTWVPVPIPKEDFKTAEHGVPETIERVLALSLVLEMPVGAFVGEATRKELNLPKSALALLKSNIRDESIHERQFQLMAQTYPVNDRIMVQAMALADEWLSQSDHTLSKAKELETAVFLPLQSILRFFGSQAIDRMASDISQDEFRHLQTNWSVCEELELRSSPELLSLSKSTLDWVIYKLDYPILDANFWHRQSDLMVSNGEAPEMEAIFNWTPRTSFFEISNKHLSLYG